MHHTGESPELSILGPMRAWRHGREIPLGPPKQRALLGCLAARLNDVVGFDEIVDAVWGASVPSTAANGVHTYVAGLRRLLEPGRNRRDPGEILVSTGGGYALFMEPARLDVARFTRDLAAARLLGEEGAARRAEEAYERALGAWRGEAYFGVPGPFAVQERIRLHELRLAAVEERADLLLALHRPVDAAGLLADTVTKEPLRERLRARLMLALYRCGRQAEALSLYRQTRQLLHDELGIEPDLELQELHNQILAGHDAARRERAPAVTSPPRHWPGLTRPAQLPFRPRCFTGRENELRHLRDLIEKEQAELDATTIVLIEGAAGVGKTAFAVRLAHEVAPLFSGGQIFLDLGSRPDGEALTAFAALGQILGGLGVDRTRIPSDPVGRIALYRSVLSGRRTLIVLDDGADADELRSLIPGGPACVLITSRRQQRGLAARDGAYRIGLGPLGPDESVGLLARLIGPGRLTGQQADAMRLAELCAATCRWPCGSPRSPPGRGPGAAGQRADPAVSDARPAAGPARPG